MLLSSYKRKPDDWNWHVVPYYVSEATSSSTDNTHPFRLIPWLLELGSGKCHSNEHPQNLVSGDNISQDTSKEPTQLNRDCTPKQTGNRSSDPWTRRDLSHPGHVNLKLTNASTSPCYALLMMLMIIPRTVNCLTCFVSAQVNQLQHAVPVQQRYKTTADHRKYHTSLDGNCYKDSEAWD